MPKWNVEKLITLVHERPELWDTRSPAYLDRVRKEVSWEKVARRIKPREWDKADHRGRAELVKNIKVRWNICRDQFLRELNDKGRSGEGSSRKRPYMYTEQLSFLRPVMELRPNVDNLEDSEDSELGASETPPVFPPETSPPETAAVEPTEPAMAPSGGDPEMPQTSQQQPRRRRNVRQPASEQVNREMIDARVIEFLAQRQTDGQEESMLRGLAPLMKHVPTPNHHHCVAALALVLKMYTLPYQGDILYDLNQMLNKYTMASSHQPTRFAQAAHASHGPPSSGPSLHGSQERNPPLAQSMPVDMFSTGAPQAQQVRPGSSFVPGSFTRDMFDL